GSVYEDALRLGERHLYDYFFSLTITVFGWDTGLAPSEDRNVSTIATGTPLCCLSARFSALSADALGFRVTLTRPGAPTALPPLAKTIFAGRHRPPSLICPSLHLLLDAKAPNLPFGKVASQLSLPGLRIDVVSVIAPVLALIVARAVVNALLGVTVRVVVATGVVAAAGTAATLTVAVAGGLVKP